MKELLWQICFILVMGVFLIFVTYLLGELTNYIVGEFKWHRANKKVRR